MQKPAARTAPALLDEMARRQPDWEAVVDGPRRWSYGQLRQESQTVAAGLWALGVRPGDRVAILMGNRAEWLSSYFAILGLGATAVALNTWLTPPEQAYQLNHADVTTLILADRFRGRDVLAELDAMRAIGLPTLVRLIVLGEGLPAGATPFADLASLGANVSDAERENLWSAARPDDVACILYTSGSTARPKGVPLQHWGLIDNMWEIGERMHLGPDDRLWFAVSLFWSFGCVNALFAVMSHGGSMVLQHHFDAGEALRLIEAERCTVFYGTPNIALALAEHPDRTRRDLSSLRTGAAIGTPEQMQLIVDLGVGQICNVYGLTEAYGNSAVTDAAAPVAQRLVASGEPLRGVELQVRDLETGQPLPRGQVGEIALRGHIMPGYLNDPETTAASMTADGFLLTGDLGLVDAKGWVQFQGRRKELIKSGGINVAPAEIEAVLRGHEAVASVFVTGLPDPRLDQAIGAVVVLQADASVSEDALRQHCRQSLAAYKVPQHFVFVAASALPVTSTEKLQRNRLAELFPTLDAAP
ncbi:MAG: AMP-binding protein [Proteobacteria bacterium]|nr:AMP-binding protein [Pseudomonadota bacterium]